MPSEEKKKEIRKRMEEDKLKESFVMHLDSRRRG